MRTALERIIEDLQKQNHEQRELLHSLSESMLHLFTFISLSHLVQTIGWRADCEKHHLETIEVVRSTANEQVPFNVQGVCTFISCPSAALLIAYSVS